MQVCLLLQRGSADLGSLAAAAVVLQRRRLKPGWLGSGLVRPFSNLPPTTGGLSTPRDRCERAHAACSALCCALRLLPSMCQRRCNFSHRATPLSSVCLPAEHGAISYRWRACPPSSFDLPEPASVFRRYDLRLCAWSVMATPLRERPLPFGPRSASSLIHRLLIRCLMYPHNIFPVRRFS